MTTPLKISAVRIARSLNAGETAMNDAALKLFAMGTAIMTPRSDGTVHPLEAQDAVDHLGKITAHVFSALSSIKDLHGSLRNAGVRHDVIGEGVLFETPGHDVPHGESRHLAAVA
jgi:hypothetical protein